MCQLTAVKSAKAPCDKPDFTIGTLRKAIPAHCFERSALRSFAYLAVDLVIIAALYKATTYFDSFHWLLQCILWPAYWYCQGAVATGVWVIAHECGHQAFSSSQLINDVTGFVLHSALLVPYFSWKFSHRRHHSNTGSMEKDEVFVPVKVGQKQPGDDVGLVHVIKEYQDVPLLRLIKVVMRPIIGWPLYLMVNASGRPYPRWANHFDPYSPIFSKRERIEVFLSDIGLLGMLATLGYLGNTMGWLWVVRVYLIPYLIVNHWLVTITFLQHTHPALPHYDSSEWDWLRGALSTVDRSYGILDIVFHHIADTHVCHHLFSQIPHYHAQEATEALKPLLKEYYMYDARPVFKALWNDEPHVKHVAPDATRRGVYWYCK